MSEWNEGVTPRNAPPDTSIGVNNDVMVKSSVKSAESNPNRQSCGNCLRGEICYLYVGGL